MSLSSKEHILQTAVSLFSKQGFAAVSMRDLAKAVDMSTAALYHHFSNKQALYLSAVQFAFTKQASAFDAVWQTELPAQEKLRRFVHCFVLVLTKDADFRCLIQRELLDADAERMQLLAEGVFFEQFRQLAHVIAQLGMTQHVHFKALSMIALVCNLIQMQPLSRYLPGWQAEHEQVDFIAEQVTDLFMNGLKGSEGSI